MAENNHPVNQPASEASSEIIGRAYKVAAVLKERALAVDRAREIPVETVKELHRSGLLSMSIPRAMRGTEADLITIVSVFEILGAACASTTWCLVNHVAACSILQRSLGEVSEPYLRAVVEEGAALGFGAGTNRSRDQGISWRLHRLRTMAFHQLFSPMPLGPTYHQGAGRSSRPKPNRARWPMFDRTIGR